MFIVIHLGTVESAWNKKYSDLFDTIEEATTEAMSLAKSNGGLQYDVYEINLVGKAQAPMVMVTPDPVWEDVAQPSPIIPVVNKKLKKH